MVEGYKRWDERIYVQEGLDKDSLYKDWHNNYSNRIKSLLEKDAHKESPYLIPPISHVVYLTDPEKINPWKEAYINKYIKTTTRLNEEESNSTHYIWTNVIDSVPKAVRTLPNVEVRTLDEFQEHPLMPNILQLLEGAKTDRSLFVKTSDVVRVIAQQAYGGVYHDLDYEIFDAAELAKYMKVSSFIGGKEDDGRFDAFMGNAFIASSKGHAIIDDLAIRINRNLNLEKDVPDYIKYPFNKFDGVICSTGPMSLTLSYFTIQTQLGDSNLLPPMMMLPARILYDVKHANAEITSTMINSPRAGTIGGDMFSGSWGTSEYLKSIDYSIQFMLAEYGFSPAQLENAKCFDWDVREKALAVIKRAYGRGTTDAEKQAKAHAVFNSIKDLDREYTIELVAEYGFAPAQLKNAKCFNWGVREKALAVIKQAYERGVNEDEGKTKAHAVFDLIKGLDRECTIELVAEYGFAPAQLKNAKCFNWGVREKALAVIKQAYERGVNEDEGKTKAHAVFDLIKGLDREYTIELVADYGFAPAQLAKAQCFNWDVREKALAVIKQAYEQGGTDAQKQKNAKAAFSLIQ